MALPPFRIGERVQLDSPYGKLVVQPNAENRDTLAIPTGTFGTVVAGADISLGLIMVPKVEFDKFPGAWCTPTHWLDRVPEQYVDFGVFQLELPLGDYYAVIG